MGCLFTGGLGCLGFGIGSVLAAIVLAPSLLGGFGTRLFERLASDRIVGSVEIDNIEFSWTQPQPATGMRLLDANGHEVLAGAATLPSLLNMTGLGEGEWRYDLHVTDGSLEFDDQGQSNLASAMATIDGQQMLSGGSYSEVSTSGGVSLTVDHLALSREGVDLADLTFGTFSYVHLAGDHDRYDLRCGFAAPGSGSVTPVEATTPLANGELEANGDCTLDSLLLDFTFMAESLPLDLLGLLPDDLGLREALGENGSVEVTLGGHWDGSLEWSGTVRGSQGVLGGTVSLADQGAGATGVSGNLLQLPTGIVERFVARAWSLSGSLGPEVNVEFDGVLTDSTLERSSFTLSTPQQPREMRATLQNGRLESVDGEELHVELDLTDPLCAELLDSLLPWLDVSSKPEGSDPIGLTLAGFSLPRGSAGPAARAKITLDLGEVSYQLRPEFSAGVMREGMGNGVYEDDVDPMELIIEGGRVTYSDLLLLLDEEEFLLSGEMVLSSQELVFLDVQCPACFLPLEGSEQAGYMAMDAVVRGHWSQPTVSFSSEMFENLRKQIEVLRGVLGDGQ